MEDLIVTNLGDRVDTILYTAYQGSLNPRPIMIMNPDHAQDHQHPATHVATKAVLS